MLIVFLWVSLTDKLNVYSARGFKYIYTIIIIICSVYRIVIELLINQKEGDRTKREPAATMPCGMSDGELPDYHDAKDKGMLCYITAEIDDVGKNSEFTIGDNKTYGQYYNAPLEKGAHYGIWYGLVVTVDGVSQSAYTKINQAVIGERILVFLPLYILFQA